MTNGMIIALWIGIIALLVLIVCFIIYIRLRRSHRSAMEPKDENMVEEKENNKRAESSYTANDRLDGARVSHRRTHPDRIQEVLEWKERKEQETTQLKKKMELERKNKLFMIFSPCNADVVSIIEYEDEAKKLGYEYPVMILAPCDDKLYAPMNGTIQWNEEKSNEFILVSDTGITITVRCKEKGEDLKLSKNSLIYKEKDGKYVAMGEMIARFPSGAIKKGNKSVLVHLEVTEHPKERLIMMKRINYVSHGDKVITIRLQD